MLGPIKTVITKPKTLTYLKNATQKVAQKTTQIPMKPDITDIGMFQQYMFSKKFHLKMDADEIKKLFSFEGDNFFTEAYNFFCKKLRIPEKLKPAIGEFPLGENVKMSYLWNYNMIGINPNAPVASKEEIFGFIRHELQHWSQNMDTLRHAEYGPKMVDFLTDVSTQSQIAGIDNIAKTYSFEQIQGLGLDDNLMNIVKKLKEFLAKNDTKSYDELLGNFSTGMKTGLKEQFDTFRKEIISEMGVLSKDSKAGKRAGKFFDAVNGEVYWKQGGNVHYGKYGFDIREEEAAVAQLAALEDLETTMGKKSCWIQNYKERIKMVFKDKKLGKQYLEDVQETAQQKGIDSKEKIIEMYRYLYE